jgi:PAS domain S-box-containing protein
MPTALVVDDHPENLYLMRCLLTADGYQVVEAENGKVALERAKEQHFDLVVSDVLMPDMDGFTLCREWRKNAERREVPFVFYTATYTDERDEAFARALGANDFIVKPIEPMALRARIRAAVQRTDPPTQRTGSPDTSALAPYLQSYNEVLFRKLQDKVRELEEANHALSIKDFALRSSTSGILIGDLAGRVTYANPAMERLTGWDQQTLCGKDVPGIVELPSDFSEWSEADPSSRDFEAPLVNTNPPVAARWVRVTAHRVFASEGKCLGVMLSCVDVSEERRLRQELSRIQRFEGLSLFAAGVAHDFNNLLMSIYAALELDWNAATDGSDRAEHQAMALAAFEQAKALTKRLLTFSKGQITDKKTVDFRPLLEDCVSLSLSGSGVRCIRRYLASHTTLNADAGQLSQVFCNVLLNARQALGDSGTVIVTLENRRGSGPHMESGSEQLVVSIVDDGPGIPAPVLPRIFEPYFTTKSDGNGLGLATSRAIVCEHGGEMDVKSVPGEGAHFEITLPVAETPVSPRSHVVPLESPVGVGRILVMDDEVVIQALLKRALERAGYSVVVVGNGDQALLEFHRAQESQLPFDLLVFDLTVKGGLGGQETLLKLRRDGYQVPAIGMTGRGDESTLRQAIASGFAHVLGKPFLMHELLGLVVTNIEVSSIQV